MRALLVVVLGLFTVSGLSARALGAGPDEPFYASAGFEVAGDSYDYVDLGLGTFAFHNVDDGDGAGEVNVEFRLGRKYYFVGPLGGMFFNTDSGAFVYAGFYADLSYGSFVITPVAAMGLYHDGASRDLGGNVLFRLALNLAYQTRERLRLGLRVAHVSNANVFVKNPGEDELLLTIGRGF